MPENAEAGIIKGLYLFASHGSKKGDGLVRLLGSGAILPEVAEAAKMLEAEWDVSSEVWSATSYSELARDAREAERRNRLNPLDEPVVSHLAACLSGAAITIAASDYVRAYPHMIAAYLRPGSLRSARTVLAAATPTAFFEVDRRSVVIAALASLATEGLIAREVMSNAIAKSLPCATIIPSATCASFTKNSSFDRCPASAPLRQRGVFT
jgi:pyruvate dehydrogenase E1 component